MNNYWLSYPRLSSRAIWICLSFLAPVFLATLLLLTHQPAYSTFNNFTVDSFLDVDDANPGDGNCNDGSGNCTLRAAISEGNALAVETTITLSDGTYSLTLSGASEDANATGDLDISANFIISGTGTESTIIQAGTTITNAVDRIFHITDQSSSLSVSNLTLQHGKTPDGVAGEEAEPGGAIHIHHGELILVNTVLKNNATGNGGPIGGSAGDGGAVSNNHGQVSVINSLIHDNQTGNGGDNNSGSGIGGYAGFGGGIYNLDGTLIIDKSTIKDNLTGNGGDGSNGSHAGFGGYGGGVFSSGTLLVTVSTISGNLTGNSGVAVGGGEDGFGGNGGGLALLGGSAVISATTISSNTVGFGTETNPVGGGVFLNIPITNLDIINSTISANRSHRRAGGLMNFDGTTRLFNVTFSGNIADTDTGGLYINEGSVEMINSIVTDSSGGDCDLGMPAATITGTANLIDDHATSSCMGISTAAVTNFDTNLADNGGPTLTHALLFGSNGRNTGFNDCPDNNGSPLLVDQRGEPRPQGAFCDIGAFEMPNIPPLAGPDMYSLDEDEPLEEGAPGVLINDSDPEGDPIFVDAYTQPVNGRVSLAADGSFVYTPTLNFFGEDIFSYEVSDGGAETTAVVTMTIHPVNDAPVATDDFAVTEVDTAVTAPVLDNDFDIDGNLVLTTLAIITDVVNGVTTVDLANGNITYTPTLGSSGTDSLVYEICDDGTPLPSLCNMANVTVTINIPPTVNAGENIQADEGEFIQFNGSFVDPDDGGQGNDDYLFHWDFGDGQQLTGTLTPTHAYVDNGTFTVTLTVTDTLGSSGQDDLLVTVANVPPQVYAGPDDTAAVNFPYTFNGLIDDPGADTFTIEWDFGDGITVTGALTPTHIFTALGVYTITLQVIDDDLGVGLDTVQITVVTFEAVVYLPLIWVED